MLLVFVLTIVEHIQIEWHYTFCLRIITRLLANQLTAIIILTKQAARTYPSHPSRVIIIGLILSLHVHTHQSPSLMICPICVRGDAQVYTLKRAPDVRAYASHLMWQPLHAIKLQRHSYTSQAFSPGNTAVTEEQHANN